MRAQSQYLRIYDSGGVTYQRWQSYYVNTSIVWSNAQWLYVPFIAEGITAGLNGDESNVIITAPAANIVINAFESAILESRLVDLSIYQFDSSISNESPLPDQRLIAGYTGQVSGGNATLTMLTLQLGSALAPVGAQVPPRKFTTAIMGMGIRI